MTGFLRLYLDTTKCVTIDSQPNLNVPQRSSTIVTDCHRSSPNLTGCGILPRLIFSHVDLCSFSFLVPVMMTVSDASFRRATFRRATKVPSAIAAAVYQWSFTINLLNPYHCDYCISINPPLYYCSIPCPHLSCRSLLLMKNLYPSTQQP